MARQQNGTALIIANDAGDLNHTNGTLMGLERVVAGMGNDADEILVGYSPSEPISSLATATMSSF